MERAFERETETVLLAYYGSARAELVQRIHQRDQGLVLFTAVLGVLVTGAFSEFASRYAMLFAVPFVGLGATFVCMQHDSLTFALGRYCRDELADPLRAFTPALQWDESDELKRTARIAHGYRLPAHFLLLVAPQYAAAVVGMVGLRDHIDEIDASEPLVTAIAALGGAVPAILSTILVFRAWLLRRNWP